jgi:hypothetical protein
MIQGFGRVMIHVSWMGVVSLGEAKCGKSAFFT